MNFPSYTSPTNYPAQSVLDSTDYSAIAAGSQNNGVLSGCTVSPPTSGMVVSVTAGFVAYNGIRYAVPSTTFTITAASSGDRRDAIYVNLSDLNLSNAGAPAFTYAAGTASTVSGWAFTTTTAPPIKPTLPTNGILVAEIYVRGSASTTPTTNITSSEILDKRIILAPTVANPIQGLQLSVYGHSFTQGSTPAVQVLGQSALPTVFSSSAWPPFGNNGAASPGNASWPFRLASLYQTVDPQTGTLNSLRNAGEPGTTVQTTASSFITGMGQPVLTGSIGNAIVGYSYSNTQGWDFNGTGQWNPGHADTTYRTLANILPLGGTQFTPSGSTVPSSSDQGIALFQCAVNDTNDLRNLNPVGSYAAEIFVPYGSSASGVVTFTRNGIGSTFAASNAFVNTSSSTLATVVSSVTSQLTTCASALSTAMSIGGYSTTITAKYPIAGITPTAANTGLTCSSSGSSAVIMTLAAGLAGNASNYLQVGDIIYIQGAAGGYPSGGSQFSVASFDTNNPNKVNLNYVTTNTTANQSATLSNAAVLILNRMVVEGTKPFPITDFSTAITTGSPTFQYLTLNNASASSTSTSFLAVPPHSVGQFANGSGSGYLKLNPWTVNTTAGTTTITTSGGAILGRKSLVMIANAAYDGGPLITTIDYQNGTNTYVLTSAPQLTISGGKMWALPGRYDNFAIGWTSGQLVIPSSAKGGTITVWSQYWSGTAPISITYNGGTATDLANIATAIGTMTGITPTTSGSLNTGATLNFSSTPIDFWFDFTTLTQANPAQVATGANWTPAATVSTTGKTTNNSSGTGTLVTDVDKSATVAVSWEIVGTGIAKGTYVTAISGTTITMSQAPHGASNLTNSIGITFIPPTSQFYATGDPVWNGTPFTADLQVPIVQANGTAASWSGGNVSGMTYLGWWYGAPSTVTGTSDGSSSPVWRGSLIGAKSAWKDSLRTALRWARCDNTNAYNPNTGTTQSSSATGLAPSSTNITFTSTTGTKVTYAATNTFTAGQLVYISGITGNSGASIGYTGTFVVESATSSSFTVWCASSVAPTTTTGTATLVTSGAGSGGSGLPSYYYAYTGHNKIGTSKFVNTSSCYTLSSQPSRLYISSGAIPQPGQAIYITTAALDTAGTGTISPSVVYATGASAADGFGTYVPVSQDFTQFTGYFGSLGSYTTTGAITFGGTSATNVPAAGIRAARIGQPIYNPSHAGTATFTNGSTTVTVTNATGITATTSLNTWYITTDDSRVAVGSAYIAIGGVSGTTITLTSPVTVTGGGSVTVSFRYGRFPQTCTIASITTTNSSGDGTITFSPSTGASTTATFALLSTSNAINASFADWYTYADLTTSMYLGSGKSNPSFNVTTNYPQIANFSISQSLPDNAQRFQTSITTTDGAWTYRTGSSLRSAIPTASLSPTYTLNAKDASSTGEIVVLYPARPRYDSSWNTIANWSLDAQVNGTGAVKTIQRASNFPFLAGPYTWTQLTQSPMSALLTQNNGVATTYLTAGGGNYYSGSVTFTVQSTLGFPSSGNLYIGTNGPYAYTVASSTSLTVTISSLIYIAQNSTLSTTTNSVSISKTAGDPGYNIAEFDCVFTTTSTPPWCVFVPDPTAVNGFVYSNYQYHELMQAYNDLSAEAEFAWYVGVVPPIQTLTLNDLAHADSLHPNTYGQAKVAQAVGQYLSSMLGNFVISTPYPRPYGSGSTAGLGNRIGYY